LQNYKEDVKIVFWKMKEKYREENGD
jgi:hypothetical protein